MCAFCEYFFGADKKSEEKILLFILTKRLFML